MHRLLTSSGRKQLPSAMAEFFIFFIFFIFLINRKFQPKTDRRGNCIMSMIEYVLNIISHCTNVGIRLCKQLEQPIH